MTESHGTSQPNPWANRLWVIWALFFFQFAGVGVYYTYLNIYYHESGLSGTQIGLLNMVSGIIAVVGVVVWGNIADRTGKNRLIIAFGAVVGLSVTQFVPLVHGFWAYLGLASFGSLASSSLSTLVDSTALAMLGDHREDYGRYRLGGSIGYIITSMSGGFIFDRLGLRVMFPAYGILMAIFAVFALLLPNLPVRHESRDLGAIGTMIRQPRWILFTAVVFLVWIASNSAITFMGVVLKSMGATEGLIGLAVTIGAVIEMPFMAFSGNLIRRFGPVKLLIVAMILSILRFFFLGLLRVPAWAIAINMLNGPAYVLFWNSSINYASRMAPKGLLATAQGLLSSATGLAGVVAALLAGVLFDHLGVGMFEVMSALCFVGLVLFTLGNLRWRREEKEATRETA